jgi:hypothetical protein
MTTVKFLTRFYVPILIGLGLIVAGTLLSFPEGSIQAPTLKVSLLGLSAELPVPDRLRSEVVARCLFWIVGSAFGLFGLTADFSSFFPRRLKMDVFFDTQGISESIDAYPNSARQTLRVDQSWKDQLHRYDSVVKETLREILLAEGADVRSANALKRANLHAHGETTLVVRRVSPLCYRICESDGHLEHRVDAPGVRSFAFRTEFALRPTAHDYIQIRIRDVLCGGHLLRPEFKQVLRVHGFAGARAIDHVVVGATMIRVVPVPWIGRTVYFWRDGEHGKTVPIAYAVYYWSA